MAITTRNITGTVLDPDGNVITKGYVRIRLHKPIVQGDDFVAPFRIEYTIENGELPVDAKLAVPGLYEFALYDIIRENKWVFDVAVLPNSGTPISIAELYSISKLDEAFPSNFNLEHIDASLLGSNGAASGLVLTSDGSGGTYWGAGSPSSSSAITHTVVAPAIYYAVAEGVTHVIVSNDAEVEVALPSTDESPNRVITIKKVSISGEVVTIIPNNPLTETIDGAAEQYLTYQYESISLLCQGNSWYIF